MKTTVERFWDKVNKLGPIPKHCPDLGPCWLWMASCYTSGYGQFWNPEVGLTGAHRFAYEIGIGKIPVGLSVLHHCDNKKCVNYESHLFVGTQLDNLLDMRLKGRCPLGESRPNAKLTCESVANIRRRALQGEDKKELAKEFGVHYMYLCQIVRKEKWRHVE